VIDGPFSEAKELTAGYTLIQSNSREEAIEWSKRFPNPVGEGAEIEVRQLLGSQRCDGTVSQDRAAEEVAVAKLTVCADVFIPNGGIFLDVVGKERDAFLRIQIDDFDAERTQPFDSALECPAFANHDASKPELPNQTAAIPARSQRGDHA
jgi:YCII-related domain